MTDPTPLAERIGIMKDPKKQAQAQAQEMYTIPFLPTLEDEENYRRAVLDAMKDF